MTGLSSTPVAAKGVKGALSVDAEGTFSCAVLSGGKVSCWGRNLSGQLGVSPKIEVRDTAAIVPGVEGAVAVSGGVDHACALISTGSVECWGANAGGELGNGSKLPSIRPVRVQGIADAVQVGVGVDFSCALLASHSVKCWGTNYASQLGDGEQKSRKTPVAVEGITTAVSLDVAENTSCAVLSGGSVECWGGHDPTDPSGSSRDSATASTQQGVSNATEVDAEGECALISDGTVTCWGEDPLNPDYAEGSIHKISGLESGVRLGTNCALLSSGGVDCWGSSENGQLGNGTVSFAGSKDTAVPVSGISGAKAIGASGINACTVLSDSTVECWGWNYWGALGNGQQGFSSLFQSLLSVSARDRPSVSGAPCGFSQSDVTTHELDLITGGRTV